MYQWKEVPEENTDTYRKGGYKGEGKDVTILTYSKPLRVVEEAATELEKQGIEAEIVDLRTIRPMDEETIYRSVKKTNRCVVVDESWPMVSVASHVGWMVSRNCFDDLDAPVELVTGEDVPMPYNHRLELAAQPSVEKVINAVQKVMYLT